MFNKIKQFLNERTTWLAYGAPLRTPDRIEELFTICSACDFFEPKREGTGMCLECGCGLKKEGNILNKLAWSTTHCPLDPPKWEEEPNLVLVEISEEAKAFITLQELKEGRLKQKQLQKKESQLEQRKLKEQRLQAQKILESESTTIKREQKRKGKGKGGCGCGK